jgi:probable DNA metabolism protein
MHSVALAHAADFEGFRVAARSLLARGVRPEDVSFSAGAEPQSLFAAAASPVELRAATGDAPKVPRAFVELARKAAMHRDPLRFAVLYRLLWRLRDEPRLLDVDFDQDVAAARVWQKAVERDIHKMHAYVRFRTVKGVAPPSFVAWFEPAHHIVEEAAPFFVRRFPNVHWTIVTPETTATWDTEVLRFGAGGRRADAPAFDAAEDLWRSYYSSIFNPARLNVRAMRSHMPQKYWRNLPESAAIKELVRAAEPRTRAMIESAATEPPKHHRAAVAAAASGATLRKRCSARGRPMRGSSSSASSRAIKKTSRARHSSGRPESCSIARCATPA